MFVVIIIFNTLNDSSVKSVVFKVAGFTYEPFLGLFDFGILNRRFCERQKRTGLMHPCADNFGDSGSEF
jgi:hypothetical protein